MAELRMSTVALAIASSSDSPTDRRFAKGMLKLLLSSLVKPFGLLGIMAFTPKLSDVALVCANCHWMARRGIIRLKPVPSCDL